MIVKVLTMDGMVPDETMLAVWANPMITRLAVGDSYDGEDICGLVMVCAWPMPSNVKDHVTELCRKLRDELPNEAYIYPTSTLHCTIATLRSFTHGPMNESEIKACVDLWKPVLDRARKSSCWPTKSIRLRMNTPTLEGSAGIFHFEDVDGTIGAIREALRCAIIEAGGLPVMGGGDRTLGKPIIGAPDGEIPPHIPDIVHSTLLRWKAEPDDRMAAAKAFDSVTRSWTPLEISVERVTAVFETVPYMHMLAEDGSSDEFIWWST
jgi:hypothetical protein